MVARGAKFDQPVFSEYTCVLLTNCTAEGDDTVEAVTRMACHLHICPLSEHVLSVSGADCTYHQRVWCDRCWFSMEARVFCVYMLCVILLHALEKSVQQNSEVTPAVLLCIFWRYFFTLLLARAGVEK